jgi:ABC-type transporter Mla subunit MlaD
MPAPDAAGQLPGGAMLAFPDTAEKRLRRAISALNRALDEQRQAVAAFRAQMAALNGAAGALGARADALRGALDDAAAETAKAEATSRTLLALASGMEGRAGG